MSCQKLSRFEDPLSAPCWQHEHEAGALHLPRQTPQRRCTSRQARIPCLQRIQRIFCSIAEHHININKGYGVWNMKVFTDGTCRFSFLVVFLGMKELPSFLVIPHLIYRHAFISEALIKKCFHFRFICQNFS